MSEDADVDRLLTKEQIETFRRVAKTAFAGIRTDQVCDLALSALSQEAVRDEEHDLLMVAAAYRDLWLICHENTPREAKLGENLELGHLRGRLFAAIDLALKREPNAAEGATRSPYDASGLKEYPGD